jgi:cytochrome c biogenesis protein CcdA
MIAAFFEGASSILLPCSLALLVPVIAAPLVAGRLPMVAVGVTAAGATAVMWLRAAQLVPGGLEAVVAPLIGAALGVAGMMSVRGRLHSSCGATSVALGLGLLAGLMWLPCVGAELGHILTAAQERSPSSLLGLGSYAVGVFLPALAAALALIVIRPGGTALRVVQMGGAIVAGAAALLVVTGLDDRVVEWLVRLSVE